MRCLNSSSACGWSEEKIWSAAATRYEATPLSVGWKTTESLLDYLYISSVDLQGSLDALSEASQTVSPYLVGANIVYSKDEGLDWEEENRVDVLKRAGMRNLRYPGGHVVSYWDWEFPYHNAYANF